MGVRGLWRVAVIAALIAGTLVAEAAVSLAEDTGSELVHEVAPHEVGENAEVRLQDVAAFLPEGGDAVLEPGTADEELFSYDYVDVETDRLIGLDRPTPGAHPAGSFVEAIQPTPVASPSPSPSGESETAGGDSPSSPAPSSGEDSGDVVQEDGSADQPEAASGVIPELCDSVDCSVVDDPPIDLGCEGCQALVDQVAALINDPPDEGCPGSTATVCSAVEDVDVDGVLPDVAGTDEVAFVVEVENPGLEGGRWLLTTKEPDSAATIVLDEGGIDSSVITAIVPAATALANGELPSTQFRFILTNPTSARGVGLLAVGSIGLPPDRLQGGTILDFGNPRAHVVRLYATPKEAWDSTQCGAACTRVLPPARPVVDVEFSAEMPVQTVGIELEGAPEPAGASTPVGVEDPVGYGTEAPPADPCTQGGNCGTPRVQQTGGYQQPDCQWGLTTDCVTDWAYIPNVDAYRGLSGRVIGSTNVFETTSSSRHHYRTGVRYDVGPFEADGFTETGFSGSVEARWPMRGDCWRNSNRDIKPCSPDGAQAKWGTDTWVWEEHQLTTCSSNGLCNTSVYELVYVDGMGGGTATPHPQQPGPRGYYQNPYTCEYSADYCGRVQTYQPGSGVTTVNGEMHSVERGATVRVDLPQSFGATEFTSSVLIGSEGTQKNVYELRALPWMKRYYRYDGQQGWDSGPGTGWRREYWTCMWAKGWDGEPCSGSKMNR